MTAKFPNNSSYVLHRAQNLSIRIMLCSSNFQGYHLEACIERLLALCEAKNLPYKRIIWQTACDDILQHIKKSTNHQCP